MKILLLIAGILATILGAYLYIIHKSNIDLAIAGLFLITGSIACGSAILLLAFEKIDVQRKGKNSK
ncbi:MAG TPA: hypothetical protein VHT73_10780 [Thermodesulfobacteriota bacterium]|nr:hypothetical protein [Thermodesulfobacteriota bacterium]